MLWGTRPYTYDAMGNIKSSATGIPFTHQGTTPKLATVNKGADRDDQDCATEKCVKKRYDQLRQQGYSYPPTGYLFGPNSNTFANDLLTSCGFTKIYWPDGIPPYSIPGGPPVFPPLLYGRGH
jgi:hypothetical protein